MRPIPATVSGTPGASGYCATGFALASASTENCDGNAAQNPGLPEVCDAADLDEDCDGTADDADASATGKVAIYADVDGDGFGAGTSTGTECDADANESSVATDCNDAVAAVNPSAIDTTADGTDSDCSAAEVCFVDADKDGYRTTATTSDAGVAGASGYCATTDGHALASAAIETCDGSAGQNPGAVEVCDAADLDEDCDGAADDADASATGKVAVYADSDGDGFGAGTSTGTACDADADASTLNTDCNDADDTVNPDAREVCDAGDVDEDCDGTADDLDANVDPATRTLFFADADGDGYGTGSGTALCDLPATGFASAGGDCRDNDPAFHPNAVEDCADPTDYNCDGAVAFTDGDGDTFAACVDCDDADPSVNPDATEAPGDATDQDCDGLELCFVDDDGDGYLPASSYAAAPTVASAIVACRGAGLADASASLGDCDDSDPTVYAGAPDPPRDGVDRDCNGADGRGRCSTAPPVESLWLLGPLLAVLRVRRRGRV